MSDCSNDLLKKSASTISLPTSAITSYDGSPLNCSGVGAGADLNDVLLAIDSAICAATISGDSSDINYDGSLTLGCVTIPASSNLNDVISELASEICALEAQLISGKIIYNGASLVNITPTGSTGLNGVIEGIDNEIGTINSDILLRPLESTFEGIVEIVTDGVIKPDGSGTVTSTGGLNVTVDNGSGGNTIGITQNGKYIDRPSESIALNPSKDNYLDVNETNIKLDSVTIGAPAPAISTNYVRIAKIETDATSVVTITDLRTTEYAKAKHLQTDSVTTPKIADLNVTSDKLALSGVSANTYVAATVTVSDKGLITSASSSFDITGAVQDGILTYNNATSKYEHNTIHNLLPNNGVDRSLLFWDNGTGEYIADNLYTSDFGDFNITSPVNGEILVYQSGAWVNTTQTGSFIPLAGNTTGTPISGTLYFSDASRLESATTANSYIDINAADITIASTDPSSTVTITADAVIRLSTLSQVQIEGSDILVQSVANYDADYSGSYTDRSLVDKGYVTSLTDITALIGTSETNNALTKWDSTGARKITDSSIVDDGTNIYVGNIEASTLFNVETTTLSKTARFLSTVTSGSNVAVTGLADGVGATENIGAFFSASGGGANHAIRLVDGTELANRVLVSDNLGKSTWTDISSLLSTVGLSLYTLSAESGVPSTVTIGDTVTFAGDGGSITTAVAGTTITISLSPVGGATYTVTNGLTDRAYDANSTTVNELADVLATLINDLKTANIIS